MAAREPWAGLAGSYEVGKDPWRRLDLNEFRNSFYLKALDWLSRPNARTYQVTEVFVWGMSTWDMFGIYPETSSAYGTYRGSGSVRGAVSKHNIEVVASRVSAQLPGSRAIGNWRTATLQLLAVGSISNREVGLTKQQSRPHQAVHTGKTNTEPLRTLVAR